MYYYVYVHVHNAPTTIQSQQVKRKKFLYLNVPPNTAALIEKQIMKIIKFLSNIDILLTNCSFKM